MYDILHFLTEKTYYQKILGMKIVMLRRSNVYIQSTWLVLDKSSRHFMFADKAIFDHSEERIFRAK